MPRKKADEPAEPEQIEQADVVDDPEHYRRAGGYVLTPYGWVLDDKPADDSSDKGSDES